MNMNSFPFVVILACLCIVQDIDAACNSRATTCENCFSGDQDNQCGWCKELSFRGARCGRVNDLIREGCGSGRIERKSNQNTDRVVVTRAEPLSSTRMVSPQGMSLRVPNNEPARVRFQVKAVKRWVSLRPSTSDGIQVEVRSTSCRRLNVRSNGRIRCSGTRPGQTVNFEATVTSDRCSTRGRIILNLLGTRSQRLVMKVESSCHINHNCGCTVEAVNRSARCGFKGDMVCGQCECHQGFSGRYCSCDELQDDPNRCRANATAAICSGRGNCICGQCNCRTEDGRIGGRYCECDDRSCDYHNDQICSGPTRGTCDCGVCRCREGFEGSACQLQNTIDSCIGFNGEICGGHGLCRYGQCVCEAEYAGRTCEDCPTCQGKCSILKDCVMCSAFAIGPMTLEDCHNQCRVYGIEAVDALSTLEPGFRCQFRDETNCLFRFMYRFDEDGELIVKTERTRTCPGR